MRLEMFSFICPRKGVSYPNIQQAKAIHIPVQHPRQPFSATRKPDVCEYPLTAAAAKIQGGPSVSRLNKTPQIPKISLR